MNKYYLLLFSLILEIIAFGQSDYYSKDSTTFSGVTLIGGTDYDNSRYCTLQNIVGESKFTPYEVKEYGFKDGRKFFSSEIQIGNSTQKVFLERLVKGKTSLYFYKGKRTKIFFIERDSSGLIEIPKNSIRKNEIDFHDILIDITSDCEKLENLAKLVSYNKKSMTNFLNRYKKCIDKPFPFLKYGIISSFGMTKLSPSKTDKEDYLSAFDYTFKKELSFGIFMDKPIEQSNFSIYLEMDYSKVGFSYNTKINSMDVDFLANITSLKLPVLVRYAMPLNKLRPFVNAGGYYCMNLRNESAIYEATITQNVIEISNSSTISYFPKKQLGYSVGAGLQINLNYRHNLFIELRHNKLFGAKDNASFNRSEFQLLTGINF